MKQVPAYLFILIFFFIYDDIWFSYEEYPIIHTVMVMVLACIAMLYAVGQGAVMRQVFEIVYEQIVRGLKVGKNKIDELRGSKTNSTIKEPERNQ
jgi:hypothetical protein